MDNRVDMMHSFVGYGMEIKCRYKRIESTLQTFEGMES